MTLPSIAGAPGGRSSLPWPRSSLRERESRRILDLSKLVWLDLAGNRLSGPIPSELGALERLMRLSLWRNDLTGSIPR